MVSGQGWKRVVVVTIACAAWLGATILTMAAFHGNSYVPGTVIINQLTGAVAGYAKPMLILREGTFPAADMSRAYAAASFQAGGFPGKKPVPVSMPQAAGPEMQLPWRKLLGFVAGSICGLYAVTKAASSLSSPLLGRIIYFAFFCGIFLFAYTSYAESSVTTYCSLKEKVLDILETADVR